MSLRTIGLLAFGITALLLPAAAQKKTWTDAEVMKIHRSALLIDTHNDVTSKTVDGFDIGPRAKDGHTDIARMKEGGQGGIFFAVYVGADSVEGNHGHIERRMLRAFSPSSEVTGETNLTKFIYIFIMMIRPTHPGMPSRPPLGLPSSTSVVVTHGKTDYDDILGSGVNISKGRKIAPNRHCLRYKDQKCCIAK